MAKKTTAPPAAGKAGKESPIELVQAPTPGATTNNLRLRQLNTDSPGVKKRYEAPDLSLPLRGPQTGQGQMGDAEFIANFGTPSELAIFRSSIEARRAKEPENWIWVRCDNPRCGLALKVKPTFEEGECCTKCNWMRRVDLGHVHRMTPAQTEAYLKEKAVKDHELDERARRAAWAAHNEERRKAGREEMSFEDFKEMRAREFQEQLARDRQLGEMASKSRDEVLR